MLTQDLLIPESDNTVSLNTFNEYAAFIGSVVQVNDEKKDVRMIRFESENFLLEKCKNIHEAWLAFHHNIELYCKDHPEIFSATHPSIVKL